MQFRGSMEPLMYKMNTHLENEVIHGYSWRGFPRKLVSRDSLETARGGAIQRRILLLFDQSS